MRYGETWNRMNAMERLAYLQQQLSLTLWALRRFEAVLPLGSERQTVEQLRQRLEFAKPEDGDTPQGRRSVGAEGHPQNTLSGG